MTKGQKCACSTAIKEISPRIDVIWVLVSWHWGCFFFFSFPPKTLIFVVKDKPKSCRTSSTSPVISVSVLTIYTSTVAPRGYVSPSRVGHGTTQLPPRRCRLRVCCVALLALNLGSGLFFKAVNIGQSRCLCKCLRPFIIANHVIHPGGLCFLTRTRAYTHTQTGANTYTHGRAHTHTPNYLLFME